MAHIWIRSGEGNWRHQRLDKNPFPFDSAMGGELGLPQPAASYWAEKEALHTHCEGPVQELAAASAQNAAGAMLRAVEIKGVEEWVLMSAPETRVRRNGAQVHLGLTLLRDRDDIQLYGSGVTGHFYFSTERLIEVEPAPAGLSSRCPRCKDPIAASSAAVRCGACGAWHHQREDRSCWTYTKRCAACHQQETSLGGQFHWSPAEL